MSLAALFSHWRSDPQVGPNIIEWRTLPPRNARFEPIPDGIHPDLKLALDNHGIQALYSHQVESFKLTAEGENIIIVTGTASGKTLCYNLPVLNRLLFDRDATALYIFPTKALSQDQFSVIESILDQLKKQDSENNEIQSAIYDGDTPVSARQTIRGKGRLILTNPDMLHTGILPHHTGWASFFRGLRFVIIDEVHSYRGVFGSHVANVIRRLKRIARFYSATPQFILTSATIGNPSLQRGLLTQTVSSTRAIWENWTKMADWSLPVVRRR